MSKHQVVELAPAAPPAAITGLQFAGIQLSDWVLLLNLVYVALGIAWLIYKAWRTHKNGSIEK